MWIRATCRLEFQMGDATPLILMLRPRSGIQQWVSRESYSLEPSVPVVEYTDIFGNLCQRLVAPAGHFSITTSADVMTADVVDKKTGEVIVEAYRTITEEHLAALKVIAIKHSPKKAAQDLKDIKLLLEVPGVDQEKIRGYFTRSGTCRSSSKRVWLCQPTVPCSPNSSPWSDSRMIIDESYRPSDFSLSIKTPNCSSLNAISAS